MANPAIEAIYADVAAASPYQNCSACGRRLHNPDDRWSTPVKDQCRSCATEAWSSEAKSRLPEGLQATEDPNFVNTNKKEIPMTQPAAPLAPLDPPWSFTHLDTFETCGWLYANKYESGYKTVEFHETVHTKAGTRVHQQLRLRLESRAKGKGPIALPDELMLLEPICAAMETRGEVRVEISLGMTKSLKPIDFFDKSGQVWHRGKLDVLIGKDDGMTIFDWKTGNPAYEKPHQLELNSILVFVNFPEVQRISTANIYTRNATPEAQRAGKSPLGLPRHYTRAKDFQGLVADMYSRYDDLARSRAAGVWPAMPGPFCRGCEVVACGHRKEKV